MKKIEGFQIVSKQPENTKMLLDLSKEKYKQWEDTFYLSSIHKTIESLLKKYPLVSFRKAYGITYCEHIFWYNSEETRDCWYKKIERSRKTSSKDKEKQKIYTYSRGEAWKQ